MALPLPPKRIQAAIHDLVAVAVCWFMAYWLRFNLEIPQNFLHGAWTSMALALCINAPSFWFFGLYRGIWRYASLMDLRRIILSVGFSALLVSAAVFMLSVPLVPRSVLVLHPMLLIMTMGGSRFAYRAWKDRAQYGRMVLEGQPVLVLGTGDAAERLLRELIHSPDWSVVGLLSAEPYRVGHELRGVKILGLIDELPQWVKRFPVRHAIVAMPEMSQTQRRHAMELAVQAGLSVLTVPSLEDMLSGKVAVSQVRQVQLEDLLGREPVQLDAESFAKQVGRNQIPVVVDFWAPWCGPCRQMAPGFAQAAKQLEPQVRFAKLDTEAYPHVAQPFNIRSIPTMVVFQGGQEVQRISGALPPGDIVRWVQSVV